MCRPGSKKRLLDTGGIIDPELFSSYFFVHSSPQTGPMFHASTTQSINFYPCIDQLQLESFGRPLGW